MLQLLPASWIILSLCIDKCSFIRPQQLPFIVFVVGCAAAGFQRTGQTAAKCLVGDWVAKAVAAAEGITTMDVICARFIYKIGIEKSSELCYNACMLYLGGSQ